MDIPFTFKSLPLDMQKEILSKLDPGSLHDIAMTSGEISKVINEPAFKDAIQNKYYTQRDIFVDDVLYQLTILNGRQLSAALVSNMAINKVKNKIIYIYLETEYVYSLKHGQLDGEAICKYKDLENYMASLRFTFIEGIIDGYVHMDNITKDVPKFTCYFDKGIIKDFNIVGTKPLTKNHDGSFIITGRKNMSVFGNVSILCQPAKRRMVLATIDNIVYDTETHKYKNKMHGTISSIDPYAAYKSIRTNMTYRFLCIDDTNVATLFPISDVDVNKIGDNLRNLLNYTKTAAIDGVFMFVLGMFLLG